MVISDEKYKRRKYKWISRVWKIYLHDDKAKLKKIRSNGNSRDGREREYYKGFLFIHQTSKDERIVQS